MELITPRLILRDLRMTDLDALCEMESDPALFRYEPGPYTPEQTRSRLETSIDWDKDQPRKRYKFGITIRPEDRVIGRLSLSMITPEAREWEIGWTVNNREWGKGYATEAAQAVMVFAFKTLNIHRLIAFCHAENAASARVMEKIGMRREAYLRETRWLRGGWYDELLYAILDKDYTG